MKPRLCLLKPTFNLEQYPRVNPELPELEVITNQWAIANPGDRYIWLRKDWTPEDESLLTISPFLAVMGVRVGEPKPDQRFSAGVHPASICRSLSDSGVVSDIFFWKDLWWRPPYLKEEMASMPHLMGWTKRKQVRPAEIAAARNSYEYFYAYWKKAPDAKVLQWEAVVPTRGQVRDYYINQPGGDLATKIIGYDYDSPIRVEYPNNCLTARDLCGWFIEGAGYPFLRDRHGAIVESDLDKVIAAIGDAPISEALEVIEDLQPPEAF